jgi:ABC-2 type transport system permease protein
MNILGPSYHLAMRAVRESLRQPGVEVSNIFIPVFFFFVTVGAIGEIAAGAFGVVNYEGFQVPVGILQAVAGASAASGIAVTTDIERGYFDKLLLTPTPRIAILLGRLIADGIRSAFFAAIVLLVGGIAGAGMEAGPLGYVVILLLAALFGAAYSGIGLAIGLKTGSPQAAQAGFLIFFPLLFLSPAFAPKEIFAGWLEFLATINPVTYILNGMRALILSGWDAGDLVAAFASIGGLFVITAALSLLALRTRVA